MKLTIEFDREDDGRWIADIPQVPGAMAYGDTRREAELRAKAVARAVLQELRTGRTGLA